MLYPRHVVIASSKITSQGQISVPAEIRRKLGVGPGSVLEWIEDGEKITVKRAGQYSFEDIRRHLFKEPAPKQGLEDLKEGIRRHMRKRHAKR